MIAYDEQEGHAFRFFSSVVGPVLSGPMDAYFWTHLVMQFGHFTPAVRHSVITISLLYEDFFRGSRIVRVRQNPSALVHYNAAIQEIKAAPDEQLVLMVCILFVCVELLQGDLVAATRHCHSGIAILERFNLSTTRASCPWVIQYLLPIFRRLSYWLFPPGRPDRGASLPKPSLTILEIGPEAPCVPDWFMTVTEASNSLDQIRARCGYLSQEDKPIQEREQDKTQLRDLLHSWSVQVSAFESRCKDSLQRTERLAVCNLRMQHEKERICLDVRRGSKSFEEEVHYDRYLSSFKSIVDGARRASRFVTPQKLPPDNAQRPSFSFEMGFLPVLFFVVMKCRHLEIRLEALSWIPRLCAAKESLMDLGTLFRVSIRLIEIEHRISLDCDLGVQDGEKASGMLGATEMRVVGSPVDHEIETVTKEDGTISCRRTVRFIMQDSDETVSSRQEYLEDDNLRHSKLQIPGMRCAR
ncbi:hypothetical protein BP6252_14120 [Coleophoma cylindrospora]|uniref:Transcription factor domain-containing protein n=1 Tax=Coleophoma cylindrospora TaxID=1849047 RepID=A0A3D8Q4B8_9HELO|nr:hypothetical protein BP6252_14120 [Coleophoma cylindrospora]